AGGGEIGDDTGAERRLGADHYEVNAMRLAERGNRGVIGEVERHQLAFPGDAGIAGSAIEPIDQRARRELPGERVLAPARAEEEDVHGMRSRTAGTISPPGVARRDLIARDTRRAVHSPGPGAARASSGRRSVLGPAPNQRKEIEPWTSNRWAPCPRAGCRRTA